MGGNATIPLGHGSYMQEIMQSSPGFNDVTLLKLAREIAMDIRPLEDLLASLEISAENWGIIQSLPTFQTYLRGAVEEWQSATNTQERVRLKSLSFVEEALPEFFARAHDPKESLAAKTEVLKAVAKFAGVGGMADAAVSGEKLTVTINLGADNQLKIERDVTPRGNDYIEGEAL
jgi:hypothetical protein